MTSKYEVSQKEIDTLLTYIKDGEIAIPEIQRPFVWKKARVRDLIDSLYQGYPVGYIITWKNPNIKLKEGKIAEGKRILIDGQQRITALTTTILRQKVIDSHYKETRITIAFNPFDEKFEVFNAAIDKDKKWIKDISEVLLDEIDVYSIVERYCAENNYEDKSKLYAIIQKLKDIKKRHIGLIELAHHLEIDEVTDIFIRINSKGVILSQADFAMSKIATNEENEGSMLRKTIDYFCHSFVAPNFIRIIIEKDKEFAQTSFFNKMKWLECVNDDTYAPKYTDMLRVAFTYKFHRGKLADLVNLLSGRNFTTREYQEDIVVDSFKELKEGICAFMNKTNFKRFIMIVKSAGFVSAKQIRSQNVLNFAYILYLKMKEEKEEDNHIEQMVQRWLVMSILTGRYSGSPETSFDRDIRNINQMGVANYLKIIEEGELSDAFWNTSLVQSLGGGVATNSQFNVFLAAQAYENDEGFLSKSYTVKIMLENRGDVHHIFPKDYLKNDFTKNKYNQVANYVYTQSEINIKIGNSSPQEYFKRVINEFNINTSNKKICGINSEQELLDNLKKHCIPKDIIEMNKDNFENFLTQRQILIAQRLKQYYFSL